MSAFDDKIKQDAEKARHLHDTFRKFVPKQFIDHLTIEGPDELALGHADEDEVAVMFVDIKSFTSLCETMTPQQILNFLNAFFTRMNSPIQLNHGFVDKFIGDAILALFDRPEADHATRKGDAIAAALGILQALELYNEHRANSGYSAVEIGIGIHFGPVIIGTVGSHDRMDTTVIGDTVNIAQRLERLTRKYSETILVSEEMIAADVMSKGLHNINHRFIESVTLKGKSYPINIHAIEG